MSALALFDGIRRPTAAPRLVAGACPLCGAPMARMDMSFDRDGPVYHMTDWSQDLRNMDRCHLGTCAAAPALGSPEAALIEANREVLRGELLEVEFSFAALAAATALAKARGTPHTAYVEQRFPLAMRRRILRGYVGKRD